MSVVSQRKFDGTRPGAVEELAVEGSRGKDGASWQTVENAGKNQNTQGMWEYFSLERAEAKKVRRMPRKRSRKGYKANGNESLMPKNV